MTNNSTARAASSEQRAANLRRWREHFPNSRRDWCIWILTLGGACAFSIWLGYPKKFVPPPNAGLVVDEKELDFGEAWEAPAFPWKFTIQNPTTKDVDVKSFWSSCWCAKAEPTSIIIPARGNAQLSFVLDLSAAFSGKQNSNQSETNPVEQLFEAQVVPEFDYPHPPNVRPWTIKGRVVRTLSISPSSLELYEGCACGVPFPRQKAIITAETRLAAIVAYCPEGSGHVASVQPLLGSQKKWELELSLSSDLRPGPFKFEISLHPVTSAGRSLGAVRVPVQGLIHPEVSLVPNVIHIGSRLVGDQMHEKLALRWNAVKREAIDGVRLRHSSTNVTVSLGPSGDTVDVAITVDAPGQNTQLVRVELILTSGRVIISPLAITYYGMHRVPGM